MAFCTKCGAALEEGTKFCTACGASVADETVAAPAQAAPAQAAAPTQAAPAQAAPAQAAPVAKAAPLSFGFFTSGPSSIKKLWSTDKIGDAVKGIVDTTDETAEHDAEDVNKNKVFAILSYIWLLWLIPFFAARGSKYAMYHAKQGLTLCLFFTAYTILVTILSIAFSFIPVVGIFLNVILWLVDLIFVGGMVIGICNAAMGKARELPFIGHITFVK